MDWLKSMLLYCGITKDEYNSIKKDAYISNFVVWKYLHIFICFVFLAFAVSTLIESGISGVFMASTLVSLYSAVVTILFNHVLKKDSIVPQFIIYLSMTVLLLASLCYGLMEPDMKAVSFVVILLIISLFMIDRPFFMVIVIVSASVVYLSLASVYKSVEAFNGDFFNVIIFGTLSIIINIFYNSLRVREFLMIKQYDTLLEEEKEAKEDTERLSGALQSMCESLIEVMGDIVESRDSDSGDHIQRVKGFTFILANQVMEDLPEYQLDTHTVNMMTFASALHDVGKISIPDSILLKPGKLTDEEFEIMKTHSKKGCDIIMKMSNSWSADYLKMGLDICGYHHEKWDGKGYPYGLKGDEIPIAAQIVSLADVFDALTTKRVYKDAFSCEKAAAMINNGECGVFSAKLLGCFNRCLDKFVEYAEDTSSIEMGTYNFEVVKSGSGSTGFVVGFHNHDKTLQEKLELSEELSVISSLTEKFCYICYVDMKTNEIHRFMADEEFDKIIKGFSNELCSYEAFDTMLNTIIVAEDYEEFREATDREKAVDEILRNGSMTVKFRVRLSDGVHHCKMRISTDPNDKNAVIIGILMADDEHEREVRELQLMREIEESRREKKHKEMLEDQLAVINCLNGEYDYVCSLNAETMEVNVYRAEPWIRDMFKNLEDIVVSPKVRETKLKGIIYPEDFAQFAYGSKHENVMKGLMEGQGLYTVNYRAYKYGKLINYQTRYTVDKDNPKRIIIGLRSMDEYVSMK